MSVAPLPQLHRQRPRTEAALAQDMQPSELCHLREWNRIGQQHALGPTSAISAVTSTYDKQTHIKRWPRVLCKQAQLMGSSSHNHTPSNEIPALLQMRYRHYYKTQRHLEPLTASLHTPSSLALNVHTELCTQGCCTCHTGGMHRCQHDHAAGGGLQGRHTLLPGRAHIVPNVARVPTELHGACSLPTSCQSRQKKHVNPLRKR